MNCLTRLAVPLAIASLLVGCQGSRPAFTFAPTPAYLGPRPVATAAVPAAPVPAAPATDVIIATPVAPQAVPTAAPRRIRFPRRLAAGLSQGISQPAPAVSIRQLAALRPHRHRAAPARVAESGLGGVVLFFLAVVLGLLAGLGALVALIPGVSFWGGVGLAAAGLLVLFLLYSLLSGGKKAKTKTK